MAGGGDRRAKYSHGQVDELRTSLQNYISTVRSFPVNRADFLPLLTAVLFIRPPKLLKPDSREAEDWISLQSHLIGLRDRYLGELGETAYAAFNAMTDFASHPPANRHVHRERSALQRLAGAWLADFSVRCRQADFAFDEYVRGLTQPAPE